MSFLLTSIVLIAAIAAVTVAVCLGKIDAQTFAGIVGTVIGAIGGAGIHAAGSSGVDR